MTPIQRTPWRFYLVMSLIVGGLFGAIVVITGLANARPLGSLLVMAAVIAGAILLFALIVAVAAYPPVSVDFTSRTVRMRRRDVPISTITQAWRRIADGRSSLLFYRLVSTDGPRARLLVAGTGFPVLDTPGRQALLDLLRAAPIEKPAEPAEVHSMRWQRVGVSQMVRELKRLDLDLTVGLDEDVLRADAVADGRDPDDQPLWDERLR